MASFGDVLAVMDDFRNALETEAQSEQEDAYKPDSRLRQVFSAHGGTSAFATPLTNVHASGVGIRVRHGRPIPGEFVIKLYVFEKLALDSATPALTSGSFQGVGIDVEPLPIQFALTRRKQETSPTRATVPMQEVVNRARHRPVIGGVSIAPVAKSISIVGTLGCLLRRAAGGREQIFALSNNHVIADTNRLPAGTQIVQPGPEVGPAQPADVFAALSELIPIRFPESRLDAFQNRYDAAIALVTDYDLIQAGRILGIDQYAPTLASAVPGMKVIKSGRTTGVTTGIVTATRVDGVQVNYGTRAIPKIATFTEVIEVLGEDGGPFSAPGDSGSVIVEQSTGRPIALLFAGDGRTTTACDLGGVCRQFQALPF